MPRLRIDLSATRGCRGPGCSSAGPLHRHHKGHDGLIGRFVPWVARRYQLFRKEDCVDLCADCHKYIHFNYLPIIKRHDNWTIKGAMRLRVKLTTYCNQWLAGKIKGKKPTKEFLESWEMGQRAMELRRQARQQIEEEISRASYPDGK